MYKTITLLEAYSNPNLWFEKPVVLSVHKRLGKLGNCQVCNSIYIKINTCHFLNKEDIQILYKCYSCDKAVAIIEQGTFNKFESGIFFLVYNKVTHV